MEKYPVILFDGVCNLCNSSVQFIIRKDKKKQFRFAAMQGKAGQELLQRFGHPSGDLNSFVLVEEGKLFTNSTGVLKIMKLLGGKWKLLYGFIIVPRIIRDAIYRWIARNRYKWYGKRNECMVPTAELQERFLKD